MVIRTMSYQRSHELHARGARPARGRTAFAKATSRSASMQQRCVVAAAAAASAAPQRWRRTTDKSSSTTTTTTTSKARIIMCRSSSLRRDAGGSSSSSSAGGAASPVLVDSLAHRPELCDSGLPDPDMCLIPEAEEEPPPHVTIGQEAFTRGRWLVGLMAAQSLSSLILDRYSDLLREHLVVTLFLTMLVGAGGNAGNQSSIKVIRGLATGALDTTDGCVRATLLEQAAVGALLGAVLSAAGFARVYLTGGSVLDSAAIALSVLGIVSTSCMLGGGLPFLLARMGVDPANAGTSIQVVMDVLGVAITCATCNLVLSQLAAGLA